MKNLFVGNLPRNMPENDLSQALMEMFGRYGTVERVNIITDRDTGKPRGFAFVEMAADDAAALAIAGLNNQEFDGRPLSVSEARPKTERSGGGGGRGPGGYGRGRGPSSRPRGGPRW